MSDFTDLDENIERGWWHQAACRGKDSSLWFAEGRSVEGEIALAVCRRCPVRRDCLADAMAAGPGLVGIWGGTSEHERRQLRWAALRAG